MKVVIVGRGGAANSGCWMRFVGIGQRGLRVVMSRL